MNHPKNILKNPVEYKYNQVINFDQKVIYLLKYLFIDQSQIPRNACTKSGSLRFSQFSDC